MTVTSESQRIARALDSLPTLPVVALQIGEVVQSKNATVQRIAEILRTDPATSAKLLRLVNSPHFGIPGGVSDIARAIPFVGFNALYELVLSITVIDTLGSSSSAFALRELWMHSLIVGAAARELAIELKFQDPGACFTAGLLHDMGRIAVARIDPVAFRASLDSIHGDGLALREAEQRHELPPHDLLGARLARQWKFPAALTLPIEHHHTITRGEVGDANLKGPVRTIVEIVAAADHLSRTCSVGLTTPLCEDGEADAEPLFARHGVSLDQRAAICERTRQQLERSRVFLALVE